MEIRGKRFVVTGGSGFVGSHVVETLLDRGAGEVVVFDKEVRGENVASRSEVRVVEGDVTDPPAVRAAVEGADGVFHMAVLPLRPSVEDPRRAHEVNVGGSLNVFEAARDAGAQKVVYTSASSVYGDTDETMDETHPLDTRTMYGATKAAAELYLRAFNDAYGLPYVTLRYMNIYGPRQQGGLVPAVTRRLLSGESPVIEGDGSQSFDFVHVRDVADATVHAMVSDVSDETFNEPPTLTSCASRGFSTDGRSGSTAMWKTPSAPSTTALTAPGSVTSPSTACTASAGARFSCRTSLSKTTTSPAPRSRSESTT